MKAERSTDAGRVLSDMAEGVSVHSATAAVQTD